jgi:DNA-binding NarL/FixJ family response regulator
LPTGILIVDDHPLFVEALELVIQGTFPNAAVSKATSIDSARAVLDKQTAIDLVLLDLSMPGTRGLEGVIELRTRYPKLPIVVVSALEDVRIIHEVMQCGAAGFISKSTRGPDLGRALEDVMSGSVVLPKGYQPPAAPGASGASDLASRIATLTPQQVRVLHMLRQGLLNKQIAFDLGVGETTVKAHVSEILRKLKVASRTQAVIEASKIDFDSILGDHRHDYLTAGCAARASRCSMRARSSAGFTGFRRTSQSSSRAASAMAGLRSAVMMMAGMAIPAVKRSA